MFKRLIFAITICASTFGIIFGASKLPSLSAATLEHASEVKYMYIAQPLMLATSQTTSNIYLINKNGVTYELLVIKKTYTNETPSKKIILSYEPKHISVAGDYIFLFTTETSSDAVYVYDSLAMDTAPTKLTLPDKNYTAYHVAYTQPNAYTIYYAKSNGYGKTTINTIATNTLPDNLTTTPIIGTIINITTDVNGTEYLAARENESQGAKSRIYRGTAPLGDNGAYSRLRALQSIGGQLIFISQGLNTMQTVAPFTRNPYLLSTDQECNITRSYDPIAIAAVSPTEIYVIDNDKQSIDKYSIIPDGINKGALKFESNVIASKGGNDGYHSSPEAICVIDENRYVVADFIGVKLIDMSKESSAQVTQISTLFIKSLTYDNWQTLYMTDLDETVHRYDLSTQSERTPMQTGEPAPTFPLTNALGEPITTAMMDTYFQSPDAPITMPSPQKYSLDRVSGKIYYIADNGETHAIRSFMIDDYWNPKNYNHMNMTDKKVIFEESLPEIIYSPRSANLFMQTNKPTCLYEYPNSIHPVPIKEFEEGKLPENKIVKVLSRQSTLFKQNNTPAAPAFNYSYVLYNNEYYYVKLDDLKQVKFSTKNLGFNPNSGNIPYDQDNKWVGYSTRVVFQNLPIYKFPAESNQILNRLKRNYGGLTDNIPTSSGLGLKVFREITFYPDPETDTKPAKKPTYTNPYPDILEKPFYEIRLDENNIPAANGIYVGYVDKSFIIDSFLAPDRQKFTPNAHIVAKLNEQVKIYPAAAGEDPYDDVLSNKDKILIVGKFRKSDDYTRIMYYGFDRPYDGYVLTKYVVPNGITTWQIIAIIAGTLSTGVAIFIAIRHFKIRKNKLQLPPTL